MNQHQNRLKIGLYINYLIHGFGMIILTQNLISLTHLWNSSLAVASFVLSGIGIGRLIAYLIMGWISDQWGRKTTLLIGVITYLAFFILTPLNHSLTLAYGLAIVAGIANSALDSATYPLMTELNQNGSSNSVLIKAFISIGEFILPMIVLFLKTHQLWFGISFIIPAVILILNLINILTIKFPNTSKIDQNQTEETVNITPLRKTLITGSILVYGYTSMAVMIWFTQWITIFSDHIGFNDVIAHLLLSLYSIGSITGVITVVILLKKFDIRMHVFLTLNIVSLLSITTIALSRIPVLSAGAALIFGFSAAGGLMQIALNSLLSIYPKHRGILTGIFFIFGSLASFSVPIITGFIVRFPHNNVMGGDILVAFIGLIAAIIVFANYPRINQSLEDARSEINTIDKKIIQLLETRFAVVNQVHHFKQKEHINVKDTNREEQVLKNVEQQTQRKQLVPYNQAIMQNIMDNSKKYQQSFNNK